MLVQLSWSFDNLVLLLVVPCWQNILEVAFPVFPLLALLKLHPLLLIGTLTIFHLERGELVSGLAKGLFSVPGERAWPRSSRWSYDTSFKMFGIMSSPYSLIVLWTVLELWFFHSGLASLLCSSVPSCLAGRQSFLCFVGFPLSLYIINIHLHIFANLILE